VILKEISDRVQNEINQMSKEIKTSKSFDEDSFDAEAALDDEVAV